MTAPLQIYSDARVRLEAAAAKPPHGAPCNGCGLCCMQEPCELSKHVFRIQRGRCPALEPNPEQRGRFVCGLVVHPRSYRSVKTEDLQPLKDATALIIGAGLGCDAKFPTEPRSQAFEIRLKHRRKTMVEAMRKALARWGVPAWNLGW